MASAKITGFDDIDKMFDELMDTKKLGMEAVNKAAPYLVDGATKAVSAAANKGYATGGLAHSFAATKAKQNEWGTFSVVKPVGKDKNGVSYGARAAFLEYGTTRNGVKQASSPWRDRAIKAAKAKCENTMEKIVHAEWEKIGG